MQILAWLYIKITKTTASSVFEMEVWQVGTYLDDTVNAYSYCRNEAGGRWGSGGLTPENFSGPLPLQRRKTSFWNMGERCCHHLLSSSEGKLIPYPGNKMRVSSADPSFCRRMPVVQC